MKRLYARIPALSDGQWTLLIVGFAVLFRIAAAFVWQYQCSNSGQTLRFGDSNSYWVIARNLVEQGNYQYGSDQSRIFRAPLYPLFLVMFAWFEHFTGDTVAQLPLVLSARLSGCLLGGYVVWAIMRWTGEIAGPVAGRCAGLLAATYCGGVGMSIFVLSEAVSTPLMVWSFWMLWRTSKSYIQGDVRSCWYTTVAAGAGFGFACLARPSWGLWPVLAFPFLLIASIQHGCKSVRFWVYQSVIFFGILCLVMSPWWIRNYLVTGKFVPTTLQVGASLYDGWHAGASGSSDENMAFSMETMRRIVAEEALLSKTNGDSTVLESTLEWRIDRRLRQEAWSWASENPSDAIGLGLVKFRKTWSPIPQAQELSNPLIKWWEAMSYLFILCMSIIGLHRMRGAGGCWVDGSYIALPCVYLAILHMVFIGSIRYRQPGVLVLCGLAGIGLSAVLTRIKLRDWAQTDRLDEVSIGNAGGPKG